jgi:hypothetical protein
MTKPLHLITVGPPVFRNNKRFRLQALQLTSSGLTGNERIESVKRRGIVTETENGLRRRGGRKTGESVKEWSMNVQKRHEGRESALRGKEGTEAGIEREGDGQDQETVGEIGTMIMAGERTWLRDGEQRYVKLPPTLPSCSSSYRLQPRGGPLIQTLSCTGECICWLSLI